MLLHPEIEARIIINVAHSAVEAEHQAKGDAWKVVEVTSMGDLGLEATVTEGTDGRDYFVTGRLGDVT